MPSVLEPFRCFGRSLSGCLVSSDAELIRFIRALWPEEAVSWSVFSLGGRALENIMLEPPGLLLVDIRLDDMPGTELVLMIKGENVYSQVPVVLCLDRDSIAAGLAPDMLQADDFILRPQQGDEAEIKARLTLCLCRASRTLDANPLSRLPGNTSIIQRVQEMIDAKKEFSLGYADLDHFKSFNDKYGFSRGDEALLMTARVIVNTVRSMAAEYSFVGHVGGDDFVFILPADQAEAACQQMIKTFDSIVPNFYDEEDRERGFILSLDRRGARQVFPIMALSIAVVPNRGGRLAHFGEASQIASDLKKKAKESTESCYVVDRRK